MAPRITPHLVDRGCTFINQMYDPLGFIFHRTAGHKTVEELKRYWDQTCITSHFGISYPGYGYDPHDIWQYVNLWDGAGANCCMEGQHHPFFNRGGNANTYTISVEVCTPDKNNHGLLPESQVEALVYLIQYVCSELGIPTDRYNEYWNGTENSYTWLVEGVGGVGMHRDVTPPGKPWCPGSPYFDRQMIDIMARVNGGSVPSPVTDKRKKQVTQLEMGKMVLLLPPPGNSVLEIGVDRSDANVRIAGHKEGASGWEIKEINTRPPYDAWHIDIGPDKWAVDKVSVLVTEYNHPDEAAGAATIWPV